jgi:manganese/zinc/iron transport system permease protein
LLGELAFAPFDRIELFGLDVPHALVTMSIVLALTVAFIILFYKELKLSTFDAGLAASLGFAPAILHYGLMTLVSVTAVGAFDAVGVVLVVALMIAPAAAAYLLTNSLHKMLLLSVGIAIVGALGGYWLARLLNANIAGAMATVVGAVFLLVFLLAPQRGLIAMARRRQRQRLEFAQAMLAIHLLNHEGKPEALEESRVDHLLNHIRWQPKFADQVVSYAARRGVVQQHSGHLRLTDQGRSLAQAAMMQ